jgi:competence protein ComFC
VCAACLSKPQRLEAEFFCSSCRTPFLNAFPLDEQGRCALCRLGATGFDAAYSFGSYEGELRELIHLFKYGRVRTLVGPLGKLLARALPVDERFDAIVPVPLHWWKRWQRGFNQSELLAKEIARRRGIPVKRCVRRVKSTSAQAGLTNAKRRANMSGAFQAKHGRPLDGMRVLLIDDVMTTGSTAAACARALKDAGAGYVALLTVARVDRRMAVRVTDLIFSGSSEDAESRSIA